MIARLRQPQKKGSLVKIHFLQFSPNHTITRIALHHRNARTIKSSSNKL
jgi:hypothetical protein